ncbi:nudC domain-containing protein 2-like isoform X2 [Lytechinus pictus]|uniref:nudC domain-containing protein 2-like isoform X2 n=1 Tax=Lytechinus pictus TaxID=7653 RepID=UPI0030BA0D9E
MANFDEKSGVVPCLTPWGCWYQTMDEVMVEINVPEGTTSKAIKATFGVNTLSCSVPGVEIKGELYSRVVADECLWSLEDRKLVRLVLIKSNRQADNCWKSLLKATRVRFQQCRYNRQLYRRGAPATRELDSFTISQYVDQFP